MNTDVDAVLRSYKQCQSVTRGISFNSKHGILTLQDQKPLIYQYAQKEAPIRRLISPEILVSICSSPNGEWLAAGTVGGRILIWHLASGNLVAAHIAHFQPVTVVRFTDDSHAVISGGRDTRVLVYRLSDLVSGPCKPVHELTSHSQEITDIAIGKGGYQEARIYTASSDRTVCLWQLLTGHKLSTFTFAHPVFCVAIDPVERAFYVGSDQGVLVVALYRVKENRLSAVGGAGAVVDCENCDALGAKHDKITALAVSEDASQLAAGSSTGELNLWDVGTQQLVKQLRSVKCRVIDFVQIPQEFGDIIEIPALQKTIDSQVDNVILSPSKLDIGYDMGVETALKDLHTQAFTRDKKEAASQYQQLQKMYDALWQRYIEATNTHSASSNN